MKNTQKQVKEVTVLNVYKFRKIARICFEILSSNGTDKYTTCFNGSVERSSCTCPGGEFHNCYHLIQLAPRAAEYFASHQPVQAAKAPAPRQQEDWSTPNGNLYRETRNYETVNGRACPMR